jgi:hypothetical protein
MTSSDVCHHRMYMVPEKMAQSYSERKTKSAASRSGRSQVAVVSEVGGVHSSPRILLAFSSNGIDDKPCLLHERWKLQMEAQSTVDMHLKRPR